MYTNVKITQTALHNDSNMAQTSSISQALPIGEKNQQWHRISTIY